MKIGPLLAALVAVSSHAEPTPNFCGRSAPHPIDITYGVALQKADGVTIAIRAAQSEAYRQWDAELNSAYQRLLAKLPEVDRQSLITTQRAWLAYRDLEANFLWSKGVLGEEGTLVPVVVTDHMIANVKARVCELQNSHRYVERH